MSTVSPLPVEICEQILHFASPQVLGASLRVCTTWNLCAQREITFYKAAQYQLRSWLYEEVAYLFGTEEIQKKAAEILSVKREMKSLHIPSMEDKLAKNCRFLTDCVANFSDFFMQPNDTEICAYFDRRIDALIPPNTHLILDYPIDHPLSKYLTFAISFIEKNITFFPSPQFEEKAKKLQERNIKQLFVSKRVLQYENSRNAFLASLSKCKHLTSLDVLLTSSKTKTEKEFCKTLGKQKVSTFGALLSSLVMLPNLMNIRISHVNLIDEDAIALAQYIDLRPINSKPVYCTLEGNNFMTSAGLRTVAKALVCTKKGFGLFIHDLKTSATNQSGIQQLRRVVYRNRNVVVEIKTLK